MWNTETAISMITKKKFYETKYLINVNLKSFLQTSVENVCYKDCWIVFFIYLGKIKH